MAEDILVTQEMIEALAAQLSMLEDENNGDNRRWWHQLSPTIQDEFRKKAVLQFAYWQKQGHPTDPPTELYDFDNQPWKRWMFR